MIVFTAPVDGHCDYQYARSVRYFRHFFSPFDRKDVHNVIHRCGEHLCVGKFTVCRQGLRREPPLILHALRGFDIMHNLSTVLSTGVHKRQSSTWILGQFLIIACDPAV